MAASFFFVTRKSRAVFHVWFVCLLQKNMTHRFFFVVSGLFVCYARISRTISWLLRFFRYVRIPRSVSCLVCLFVTQESRKHFFSGLFACLLVREIQNTFVSVIERRTQASILMTISWICRINWRNDLFRWNVSLTSSPPEGSKSVSPKGSLSRPASWSVSSTDVVSLAMRNDKLKKKL